MIKKITTISIFLCVVLTQQSLFAGPQQDRESFVAFFKSRFPDIPYAEFSNGIYAIDKDAREQWLDIEVFPPYEFTIDDGRSLWEKKFTNGKSYSDCFDGGEPAAKHRFPKFDSKTGEVVSLETDINNCRLSNGEPAFKYGGEQLLALTAFMAYESRGKTITVIIPDSDPRALVAYEKGKQFYYSKRGQLNLSCSDCHVTSVGQYVRADRLSASLGHPTHFPVYRSKTGGMVSLHQRFSGCVRDVRAKPFALQSREFRDLEYFLTYMSNGLQVNGPGSRK